mgnify:FL=1
MSTEEKNRHFAITTPLRSVADLTESLASGKGFDIHMSRKGQKAQGKVVIKKIEQEDGSGNIWVVGGTVTNSATTTPINCVMLVNFRDPSKNWLKVT